MVAGSTTRHTRARRQLGNNNKMFPCDWFKGEPLISAPAIFRFSCVCVLVYLHNCLASGWYPPFIQIAFATSFDLSPARLCVPFT